MRHRILVVSRDVELRARLARSLSAARYSVDIAESPAHACRIGLSGFSLAVIDPAGLGAEVSGLIDKLRAATGRAVLIVGSGSSPDPTQEIVDASDEAALLARVNGSLVPVAKPEEAAPVLHFANYRLDLVGHSLVDQAGQEVVSHAASSDSCGNSRSDRGGCCPGISFCRYRPDVMQRLTTVVSIC